MTPAHSSVSYIEVVRKGCMVYVQHSELAHKSKIIEWLESTKPIREELGMKILKGVSVTPLGYSTVSATHFISGH